ncbi:hypothetical protein NP493_709g03034 [Ridgeia piscesae]|uniref:Uncharacterized protein n=1 Tax=Ridgeia piscesae TaxID=27915 RepID=A0AAD9NMS8_RIDPI|nr:hypothetical protein NP493_709g03034 [Ridgeia piscesae]
MSSTSANICPSIRGYIEASGLTNIKEPLLINTSDPVKQWAGGARWWTLHMTSSSVST